MTKEKRRGLLARMASNIAAGLLRDFSLGDLSPESVARESVAIARAILDELDREPGE